MTRYTHDGAHAPTRRRWGWTLAAAIVVLTAFAVTKHVTMGGLSASQTEEGVAALARALEADDPAPHFEQANEAFRDAASVSIVDHYPAFLLATTARLQTMRGGDATAAGVTTVGEEEAELPGDRVLRAILGGDLEGAAAIAATLGEPGGRARQYWTRFVAELGRAQPMKAP